MRRSTKLLIALLTAGVVMIPIAAIAFFTEGTTASSSPTPPASTKVWVPLRPKPPSAAELRAVLRLNGDHPTTCTAHGSRMVCLLAHRAGRCEQDADGSGSCTYRSHRNGVSEEMIWMTNHLSDTVTVTSSAGFG